MKTGLWNDVKQEARNAMVECAKRSEMITYTELSRQITSAEIPPHDVRMNKLLGEISSEEDAAGRGMLSVIVVHKQGDMRPGAGFFQLAKELGRDTRDTDRCWIKELDKVQTVWLG